MVSVRFIFFCKCNMEESLAGIGDETVLDFNNVSGRGVCFFFGKNH